MTRLYLCGPMSGLPQKNFPAFHAEAARLRALGYEVINPAELNPGECTWLEAMRVDIPAMMTCDALATLPGSGKSRGAGAEIELATRLGFDVFLAPTLTEPVGEPYDGAFVIDGVTQHYRVSNKEYSEEEIKLLMMSASLGDEAYALLREVVDQYDANIKAMGPFVFVDGNPLVERIRMLLEREAA